MERRFYLWANVTIEAVCHDSELAGRLDHYWRTFFWVTALTTPATAAVVSLELQAEPVQHTGPPGQQLWCRGDASVWQTVDGLCLQLGATTLYIDAGRGHASGGIDAAFWCYPLAEQRDFFMRSLLLLLRRANAYGLHANGISHADQGLLLVGPSGSGKTTLTLSLRQAGWRALGDDVVALRPMADGVRALALQRGFACTSQTVTFFPHLRTERAPQLDTVRQKQWLAPTSADDEQLCTGCRPTVLLFPTIIDEACSRLTPLDATQTLLGLMEQSAALFVEPRSAARQMAILHQLGRQARSYRLGLGRDVYTDPLAVAALLRAL